MSERFALALDGLNPAGTLVAAVSGGLDSMALLELLGEHQRNIVVAHFNHQLRGAESDQDEAFVRDQAAKRGFIFRCARGEVPTKSGVSIEMAARELRHGFLAEVAREFSADLVLAHHANDQIELFLMRLLRGVEGPGLAGMKGAGSSPANPEIRILRPLLDFTRAELKAFVEKNEIPFREDSTNGQLHADRNRIRHIIIPALRTETGPDFEEVMVRHIETIRVQSDAARSAAKLWLETPKAFGDLPQWLRREIVAVQLEKNSIPVTGDRIATLLARPNRRVSIAPKKTVALDQAGRLQIFGEFWPEASTAVDLSSCSTANFAGIKMNWRVVENPDLGGQSNTMIFDADRVGAKITLRYWRQGDRIRLSGRGSERPLHEMFSRNKIPRDQRHRLVVAATSSGKLFWVEGLRITEDFKVTSVSRRFLEWSWQRR